VTAVTIDPATGAVTINNNLNHYHEGLISVQLNYDQWLALLPYPCNCFAIGDIVGSLYATVLQHTYLLLDVTLDQGQRINDLRSIVVNKGTRAIMEPLNIPWKVEHPKENFILDVQSILSYGEFGCIVRTNGNHFDPVIVEEYIYDLHAFVNYEVIMPELPHVPGSDNILGPGRPRINLRREVQSPEYAVSHPSPNVIEDHTAGSMEKQCLEWSTEEDPTTTYMLYSRLYPCACRFCIINDFEKCIYTNECGPFVLQHITYVKVSQPKTESVSHQTIYDFFKGVVSADDVGPIMVLVKSNHNVGEFKLAILQKELTIVRGKKTIEVIKRAGRPDELRKWEKGDVQCKVKKIGRAHV
jgi:hypothetical protein